MKEGSNEGTHGRGVLSPGIVETKMSGTNQILGIVSQNVYGNLPNITLISLSKLFSVNQSLDLDKFISNQAQVRPRRDDAEVAPDFGR